MDDLFKKNERLKSEYKGTSTYHAEIDEFSDVTKQAVPQIETKYRICERDTLEAKELAQTTAQFNLQHVTSEASIVFKDPSVNSEIKLCIINEEEKLVNEAVESSNNKENINLSKDELVMYYRSTNIRFTKPEKPNHIAGEINVKKERVTTFNENLDVVDKNKIPYKLWSLIETGTDKRHG